MKTGGRTTTTTPKSSNKNHKINAGQFELSQVVLDGSARSESRPANGLQRGPVIENQRSYFDNLATGFNITEQKHWYKKTVEDMGGDKLLPNYYNGSLQRALETIYPEYNWNTWEFGFVQKRFWNSILNQRFYFD